jgi:Na+-transporting methylmalonyl-CoA/oxaloacetate decarboxylase gamma subunit
MRIWHYQGVHRLAWVVVVLLVLAVAIFVMAAGFSRLHGAAEPEPALSGSSAALHHARAVRPATAANPLSHGQAGLLPVDS